MILPLQFKADWARIRLQKQKATEACNRRENENRKPHEYKVGDKVLITKPGEHRPKLSAPRSGPYEITQVFTNGTVRIKRGAVLETINIRRVTPYCERSQSGSECHIPRRNVAGTTVPKRGRTAQTSSKATKRVRWADDVT